MRYRAKKNLVSTALKTNDTVLNFRLAKPIEGRGFVKRRDPKHFGSELVSGDFPVILVIDLMRHEQAVVRFRVFRDDICIRLYFCRCTAWCTRSSRPLHPATWKTSTRTTRPLRRCSSQHGNAQNSTKYQLSLHDETSLHIHQTFPDGFPRIPYAVRT